MTTRRRIGYPRLLELPGTLAEIDAESKAETCEHLKRGTILDWVAVFDRHLNVTDGLFRCASCDAFYLANLADLTGQRSLFVLTGVPRDGAERTLRSLAQGSCDLNRGREEVFTLRSLGRRIDHLLIAEGPEIVRLVRPPPGFERPAASWRELDPRGRWLAAL